MPLHLLGKKSWNVYNAANIARVKADEAAAAAREAAEEQRMQEVDAARRAAILRGETPPPLPEDEGTTKGGKRDKEGKRDGHDRKRRKLAGEDDTDMDIRLAASVTNPRKDGDDDAKVLKLRKPETDAPLTDNAGNINLFPVDLKEAMKREKNAEAEKEKKKKERAFEDQYTMRFSNAAGKGGLEKPWYAAGGQKAAELENEAGDDAIAYPGFESKNVWGNEDPRRVEREQARISSSDPFAFMQRAQSQLKKSKEDKKKWANERDRELRELRAAQERESRRERHGKRKKRPEDDDDERLDQDRRRRDEARHSRRKHRTRSRSRSRSADRTRERRHEPRSPNRNQRRHSRECDTERHRSFHTKDTSRY